MVLKMVRENGEILLIDSKNVDILGDVLHWKLDDVEIKIESVEQYDGKYLKVESKE